MKINLASFKSRLTIGILGVSAVGLFAGFLNASGSRGYVAHEWGTFTSVQGGDGVLLEWRPLETSRLPGFVHDWNGPGLNRRSSSGIGNPLSKNSFLTLQRMETPVIYFYSDHDETVDVSVNFPKGLITEWYPEARQIGPSFAPVPPTVAKFDTVAHHVGAKPQFTFASLLPSGATKDSKAVWAHLEILKSKTDLSNSLLMDRSGSHYFAARETDANLLRMNSMSTNATPEIEKFIFYRGVGSFATPLKVTTTAEREVTLSNTGTEPLEHLYLLGVENKAGAYVQIARLGPGEQRTIKFDSAKGRAPIDKLSARLGDDLAKSLVSQGLYPREARAMINTWKDSWFDESGLRVLYVLSRSWTDQTLPIKLDPAPRELVRVMVGRAEVIPPDQQERLSNAITRANQGDASARAEAIRDLKTLGRFGEPATRLAMLKLPDPAKQTAWQLYQEANTPKVSYNASNK
jgi:hypothetical protein